MTLLTIVNQACDSVGIPQTLAVISSNNKNIKTMLSLANLEGERLKARGSWQELNSECTFDTVNGQADYSLSTIAPDYDFMITPTAWNRTDTNGVSVITPQSWQADKAWGVLSTQDRFRIRGGNFSIIPTPTSAETIAFEYQSKNWCQSSGGTGQSAWAADTDTGILDEHLMTLGLIWRFLKSKGFEYQQEKFEYDKAVSEKLGRTDATSIINMGVSDEVILGGINVPDGSWS